MTGRYNTIDINLELIIIILSIKVLKLSDTKRTEWLIMVWKHQKDNIGYVIATEKNEDPLESQIKIKKDWIFHYN